MKTKPKRKSGSPETPQVKKVDPSLAKGEASPSELFGRIVNPDGSTSWYHAP